MNCQNCGAHLEANLTFCPICGAQISNQMQNTNNDYQNNQIFATNVNQFENQNIQPVFNQPIGNNQGNGSITIKRDKSIVGMLINWKIYIDGVEVGKISNGEQATYQVSFGIHKLSISNTGIYEFQIDAQHVNLYMQASVSLENRATSYFTLYNIGYENFDTTNNSDIILYNNKRDAIVSGSKSTPQSRNTSNVLSLVVAFFAAVAALFIFGYILCTLSASLCFGVIATKNKEGTQKYQIVLAWLIILICVAEIALLLI